MARWKVRRPASRCGSQLALGEQGPPSFCCLATVSWEMAHGVPGLLMEQPVVPRGGQAKSCSASLAPQALAPRMAHLTEEEQRLGWGQEKPRIREPGNSLGRVRKSKSSASFRCPIDQ